MTVQEIPVPAEPISAVIRGQLEARRAAARKQWEFATAAWRAAEQAMINERRIYDMLDCLLQAGPGHVFSAAIITEYSSVPPCCRHCRARASSITARWPCEGDTHRCPMSVRPGEPAAPVVTHERDNLLCGQPGTMTADFTAWICLRGHITDQSHAESEVLHSLAHCITATCPWPDLIGSSERTY